MSTNKSIAIIFISLSVGAAALLFHPAAAQAALYNASGVLGQQDFTSNVATTTQSGLNTSGNNSSVGAALDSVNHRLFVSDWRNARVLVFQLDANNSIANTSATYVLGQPDFSASTATTTQNGLAMAVGPLAYDPVNSRLFVGDVNNNRVLIFDVSPSTIHNGENASYVLGQPDFTSSDAHDTGQNGLSDNEGIEYDPGNARLFVSTDGSGQRILVFNVAPGVISNGENASYVLGQPDFNTNTATTTQSGMYYAEGLGGFDAVHQRLFTPDSCNNRVLIFDVNPSTIHNGENASYVLGQPDFGTGDCDTPATTQSSLGFPMTTAYDPNTETLFVTDDDVSRIMLFNVDPSAISNGENALNVLGQQDFTTSTATISQSGLNFRNASIVWDTVNRKLFVYDDNNNRILQFSFISIITSSLPNGTVGSSYSQTITATSTQGTVSFVVQNGSLPAGLSLATSTGVISGTPATAGVSSFTIEADDGFSTGNFIDRKAYTITVAAAPTPTPAPSGGGGGLPAVAYMPPVAPAGGFHVVINSGATITDRPQVTLTLAAGPDIKRMAVSNTLDFANVGQEPYSSSKSWNLCWSNPALMQPADCSVGSKTVYVKFFTDWGQSSPVVSVSSQYQNGGNAAGAGAPSNQSSSIGAPYGPGTLVNDHGTIYIVFGNARLGFTSWKALVGLGYSHRPIVQGNTSGYQDSSYLLSDTKQAHPWGSWLLSHGTVYYSSSLGLIGVPSWDVFLANGGKASLLVPANAADLTQLRLSPVLSSHDGRVAQ